MSDFKDAAKAGLEFLSRVELKGTEVGAWITVNQLLGQIMEGKLRVLTAENVAQLEAAAADGSVVPMRPAKE